MDDQHGIGTCAEAETSVSVGRGREHAEARCYAQRGAAKKCAAGLLLLASVECVGWARLQGCKAPRRPKPQTQAGREEGRLVLAEAAPTHLCTHSDACFAKRPIKASEDAWKGLRANRLRTVMIGVGAAQGGGRRERPSRAEGVRARARRACGARAERARHASGTPALAQRRPLADLRSGV